MHDSLHINSENTVLPDLERKLKSPVAYTLETKLDLLKKLKESHKLDEQLLSQLEQDVAEELEEIRTLKHLRYLGYTYLEYHDTDFVIKRRGIAIAMDIVGTLIGILFFFLGVITIFMLIDKSSKPEGLVVGDYLNCFAMSSLGLIGLFLMLKSFNRLMDHVSFRLKKDFSSVCLYKRNDMAIEQIEVDKSAVQLMVRGEKMWIEIGATKVFEVQNPSIYTRKTLEALENKLKA